MVGRSLDHTSSLAREHDVPYATSSLDDVLTRNDVDIVSIVTPPKTHLPYSEKVLAAGKHVLCEKPFTMDRSEAQQLVAAHEAACTKHNRRIIAMIDHELRFHSSVRDVKAFISSGAFGKIRKASLYFLSPMPAPMQTDWSWWHDETQFGGVLGAIGSHFVDLISFVTSTEVVKVQGDCQTLIKEKCDASVEPSLTDGTFPMKPVTSDDSTEYRALHRSNKNSSRPSFRSPSSSPSTSSSSSAVVESQEFFCTTTLCSAAMGVKRNEMILLSDKGSIVMDMSTMTATFQPADYSRPMGDTSQQKVWKSDAPSEVKGMAIVSPYAFATVLLGRRLIQAIEQVKNNTSDSSLSASASSSSSPSPSPSSHLTSLPGSLSGIGATFSDGSYCMAVLDAVRESSKSNGEWIDCKYQP